MNPRTATKSRGLRLALAVAAILGLAAPAVAATITVVDDDGPAEGFNDPTPVAPVGGNPGTTLGEQRRNAFQLAADAWANLLVSDVPITVAATMDPLACGGTTTILGQAAATTELRDFAGAPFAGTWYPAALANKLAGVDLDPAHDDVDAQFNSALGTTCAIPLAWYYGFDGMPPPNAVDFVSVVTHELAHGLGFETFVDETTGAKLLGYDDAFERHLEDGGIRWPAMTAAQRAASATDAGGLRWEGAAVTAASGILAAGRDAMGRVLMFAPPTFEVGSSVSHFDESLRPVQLLAPAYTGPIHDPGLARAVLADVGWGSDLPVAATTTPTTTSTTTTTIGCPPTPATSCRSAAPGASSLRLATHASPSTARLRWTWKGDTGSAADWPDPRAATATLRLCLYEASSSAPVMDVPIRTGGFCGGPPCWRAIGSATRPVGYRFHGPPASSHGIATVVLHASAAADGASIVVRGKGRALSLPALALTPPVTMQLLVGDAAGTSCWQTTFDAVVRDDATRFRARGP